MRRIRRREIPEQSDTALARQALLFIQSKLNVQTNMIEPRNGQSESEPEPEQSKPRGRFTGDRFLRERPRVYRKVAELLAEPGMSINQITKLCHVSEHTVRAVRKREAVSIAERKQRLMSIFGNVAELGAERMEELAPHATLRDAGVTAGIATDKLRALSNDPFSQANQQHLHVHLQPVDLIGQFNEMISKLSSSALEARDTTIKALPSGQDPQVAQTTNSTETADGYAREENSYKKRANRFRTISDTGYALSCAIPAK